MKDNIVPLMPNMQASEALNHMLQMPDSDFIADLKQEVLRTIEIGFKIGDYERTKQTVKDLLDIIA